MSTLQALHRATFESPYLRVKARRHFKATRPRLGDHLLYVVEHGNPEYLQVTVPMEFCVIDLATLQKAWFETPPGATPEQITAMVEGHFDAGAIRLEQWIWAVLC